MTDRIRRIAREAAATKVKRLRIAMTFMVQSIPKLTVRLCGLLQLD